MFDDFDEARYLAANPDVRVMVERGLFASAQDHWQKTGSAEHALGYRRSGFHEHDLIYDEATYLAQNVDVVGLLRQRLMGSGYEHWMRFGRFELLRGQRWGPFAAPGGVLRAFRLAVPRHGALLVGPAPEGESRVARRSGVQRPEAVPAEHLRRTAPLELSDALGRRTTRALLLCWIAWPGDGTLPAQTLLAGAPPQALFSVQDDGMQAVFLPTPESASELVRAAASLAVGPEDATLALIARVERFAIERLERPRGDTGPAPAVFVEELAAEPGRGLRCRGWLLPAAEEVARLRAFCPVTGECPDVTASLARVARPDVRALHGDALGPGSDTVGFSGLLPLPAAAALPSPRLLLGVTRAGGSERWLEVRAPE